MIKKIDFNKIKNFEKIKFKALFPDTTIISNKLSYNETNNLLNSFLHNNFLYNSSNNKEKNIFKFPIEKYQSSNIKGNSDRRNSILKRRPNSCKKNDFNSLIESLRHDNCISYNYFNNIKGPLSSPKNKIKNNIIFKQNSLNENNIDNNNTYKVNTNNNINNSVEQTNSNNNLLSFETNSKNPKNNIFKNFNLYKLSRQRNLKHRTIIGTNNNLDSFSLTNNILSKRHDNKITSGLQSPNSTMSKTRFKRYSLKLENESLYLSNNTMRRKSIFSLKSSYNRPERKNKERKKTKAIIEEVFSGQPNFIKLSLSENQRQFHQRIYLRNLRSQIGKFEESDQFYANEGQIKSNAILPNKFQRDIFVRQIKKASKYNDFFFKKFPFNLAKLRKKRNKSTPVHKSSNNNSKKFLKNIQTANKKINSSNIFIKNLGFELKKKKLQKIIDFVIPKENNVKDIDEEFKEETVNYHRNMGNFFFYKGSGVYSNHLSYILRGDKLVNQVLRLENI